MAAKPVKVSQLNSYIRRVLQTDPLLRNISVTGEISNIKYHDSGHVYFTMKDDGGRVNCFLPRDVLPHIRYELTDGMEIVAYGYISVYERGGYYSLNIRDIDVEGQGSLSIAYEKLREKLAGEGLFSEEHKKPIPGFPEKIAVVTSPTGAAVRDIIKIITSRNDFTDILIYPVLVQGPGAAPEIAAALDDINKKFPETDTVILGRGGGSAEELWAFNEEIVARSIFDSAIPVISAVGHETDFTIADFAADARAETPSAAAVMAVPDTSELKTYVKSVAEGMNDILLSHIRRGEEALGYLDPSAFCRTVTGKTDIMSMMAENLKKDIDTLIASKMLAMRERIKVCRNTLENLSPQNIMKKGYCVLKDENGRPVADTCALSQDQTVTIVMAGGEADSKIIEIRRRHDE